MWGLPLMGEPESNRIAEIDAELAMQAPDELLGERAYPLLYFSTRDRPSQRPFFYDTHKVCALLSENKAGKDECLIARTAILFGRGKYEPFDLPGSFAPFMNMRGIALGLPLRAWYCTPKLSLWHTQIAPKLLHYIPRELLDTKRSSDGSGHNTSNATIHFLDGSTIVGRSYQDFKQHRQGAEGDELDWVPLSEGPEEWVFKQMLSRTRTTGGKICLAATRNQATCQHSLAWIHHQIVRHTADVSVGYYYLTSGENTEALAIEAERKGLPDVAEALRADQRNMWNMLNEEERAVQMGHEWTGQKGIIFGSFNENDHVYEVPGVPAERIPVLFRGLADEGYGDIVAGMDHGQGHPTVAEYFFVASRPLAALQIIEGDWIGIDEYYQAHTLDVDHLPSLQEKQRLLRPSQYWCDPHMFDPDSTMAGCSPAELYQCPEKLQKLIHALHPGASISDLTPVGPLDKGINKPGSIAAGIQVIAAMLKRRPAPFPWPRLRLAKGCQPWLRRSFEEWMLKPEGAGGDDSYSELLKDPMDACRYPAHRLADFHTAVPDERPRFAIPIDRITGMGLDQLCSLRGLGV